MAWIENERGEVLLVRQAVGRKFWTLPGGKAKARESLRDALAREVREETNLRVEPGPWLHLMDRPERGAVMVLFGVTVKSAGKPPKLPNREINACRYSQKLPKHATPSARFFWGEMRKDATPSPDGGTGPQQDRAKPGVSDELPSR